MAGRHRAEQRRGNALAVSSGRLAATAITAVAVVAVLGGAWSGYRLLNGPSCTGAIHLSVTVAAEIAPAVRAATARSTATSKAVDGKCVSVDTVVGDPAEVAAAIAGQHRHTLAGVGQAGGRVRVPDVWIPDSSTWLLRLRSAIPDGISADAPSVARSPVIMAMPEPAATRLGWPSKTPTLGDLFTKPLADLGLRSGIVEPGRDASSLSALVALGTGATADPSGQQAAVKALRTLATERATLREELLARFPRSLDRTALASSLAVAPLSEQAVIQYNSGKPPVPLAALYVNPAPPPLDYPFAVLPGTSAEKKQAAAHLLASLAGDGYRDDLAQLGLHAADGSVGKGFATPQGKPPAAEPAKLDPAAIDRALSTWLAITSSGRMLAVIDVSGSMLQPVPTAGGATREQVTVESARRGLALLDDTWATGLWIFSTKLDGANDYRRLVPIGPLADQRQEILTQLAGIQPKPNGDTGLYDTTLAAYKTVQDGWDPSRINSVLIMTDGKNEDQQGLTLDQLVGELRKTMDPARPIQVIVIGIGDQVNEAELQRITTTTGGGTFVTPDPSKIGEVFLKAVALRTNIGR